MLPSLCANSPRASSRRQAAARAACPAASGGGAEAQNKLPARPPAQRRQRARHPARRQALHCRSQSWVAGAVAPLTAFRSPLHP
eukprot:363043-Chlamydomonas_euryale.AAC.4